MGVDDGRNRIGRIVKTVHELEAQRDRWRDPAYITTQARERLYYVRPGEVVYLIDNDLTAAQLPQEQAPVTEEVEQTRTDWMAQMVRSVTAAGLAPDGTPVDPINLALVRSGHYQEVALALLALVLAAFGWLIWLVTWWGPRHRRRHLAPEDDGRCPPTVLVRPGLPPGLSPLESLADRVRDSKPKE